MFLLLLAFIFGLIALYQLFALIADLLGWAIFRSPKKSTLPPVIILSIERKDNCYVSDQDQ